MISMSAFNVFSEVRKIARVVLLVGKRSMVPQQVVTFKDSKIYRTSSSD